MSLALFLELLIGIFKFPGELAAMLRLMQKSPEEKRQEIMVQVNAWMNESAASPRPHWEGQK